MSLLRNIDIAKKYQVSPATVQNWINYTLEKKLDLELTKVNGRTFIEDTEANEQKILKIRAQGVKFRSKNNVLKVIPDPKLYQTFSEKELISLFVNINDYNNIPVKFSYHDVGARYYYEAIRDELKIQESSVNDELTIINNHLRGIIQTFTDQGKKINIIEMGWDYSTSLVKETLEYLINTGSLNNYISVGSSQEMYNIRQKDVKDWFGIEAKKYILDIEDEPIQPMLFLERGGDPNIINICLVLSSGVSNTPNLSAFLGKLSSGFSKNDYLIVTTGLINENGENSFGNKKWALDKRILRHTWLFQALGILDHITISPPTYQTDKKKVVRTFAANQDIEIALTINNSEVLIRMERDTIVSFFGSTRFSLTQLIKAFNNGQLDLQQFNFLRGGYEGLFFLSKRNSRN